MYYAKDMVERLRQSDQLVIFGAGVTALGVAISLQEKPYEFHIAYCLVSDLKVNPVSVAGIPVIDFSMAGHLIRKDATILVAAVEKNIKSMQESLKENGYLQTIPITYDGDLWSLLRGNLYQEYCRSQGKQYLALEEELQNIREPKERSKTVSVYTVKCHVDKVLKEDITRFSWEKEIQAGAALTDARVCNICDNRGENISNKNRQYCELTALYWIWKHDESDYIGLGHYRRHFELTEDQLEKLAVSDIDVVLTIPMFVPPNVVEVYRRDHAGEDWDVMRKAVYVLCPQYLPALKTIENSPFYYAYNMFIMRREILDDYCSWLFPILSYCEEHCQEKENSYQNRFIGFLAERLLSVYFLYHEKEYKIVHARKHFIEE